MKEQEEIEKLVDLPESEMKGSRLIFDKETILFSAR